jgi:tetratricopeptide (TPR) repeat protein
MRSSWGARGFGVLVLVSALASQLPHGTVVAQPAAESQLAKDAMLEQWRQGTVEYTLGHYEAAVKHYEAAYRLYEEPALLYNLAQAYRKIGALEPSLTTYRSYLLRSPPDAPDRDLARERVHEIELMLAARKAAGLTSPTLAAPPPTPASLSLLSPTTSASPTDGASSHHWWAWALVGAFVAGGVATVLILDNRTQSPVAGTVGTATIP